MGLVWMTTRTHTCSILIYGSLDRALDQSLSTDWSINWKNCKPWNILTQKIGLNQNLNVTLVYKQQGTRGGGANCTRTALRKLIVELKTRVNININSLK